MDSFHNVIILHPESYYNLSHIHNEVVITNHVISVLIIFEIKIYCQRRISTELRNLCSSPDLKKIKLLVSDGSYDALCQRNDA